MISSNFVKEWYELAKQIITDIRSLVKRDMSATESEIIDLYAAICDIHTHYVKLFAGIENRLIAKPSARELIELRSTFFEMRSQEYTGRALSREKIATIANLDDAKRFEGFLNAASQFLLNGPAPGDSDKIENDKLSRFLGASRNFHTDLPHPSSSIRFWNKMLETDDPVYLAQTARNEITKLTGLFVVAKKEFMKLGLERRP